MSDPDYVVKNRAHWDGNAPRYAEHGAEAWAGEVSWGIWQVPEEDLGLLPRDMTGLDTVELGCGTAYVSAWMARRGARPVGIDNSPAQLATARRLQAAHGLDFPLHLGNAEATPFADASFDFAISEYGAAIWCDPHRWIPEAARILRPGGQLVFLRNSTLLMLTVPDEDDLPATRQLMRPQRGMHRFEWPGSSGVEFHVSPGDYIRIFRRAGLDVEDLLEVYPRPGATTSFPLADHAWSSAWPCEEVWKARKR